MSFQPSNICVFVYFCLSECLPKPSSVPAKSYVFVFGIFLIVWILTLCDAYALRLRRLIASFFFRKVSRHVTIDDNLEVSYAGLIQNKCTHCGYKQFLLYTDHPVLYSQHMEIWQINSMLYLHWNQNLNFNTLHIDKKCLHWNCMETQHIQSFWLSYWLTYSLLVGLTT